MAASSMNPAETGFKRLRGGLPGPEGPSAAAGRRPFRRAGREETDTLSRGLADQGTA